MHSKITDTSYAVLLENVSFRWKNTDEDILQIASFSLKQGERVFIAGPSGSGKSTLLGLIAGILTPTAGVITVNGQILNKMGSAERDIFRGNHIGFIFQQFNLLPYLSVLENVLLPCHFSPLRLSRVTCTVKSVRAKAQELLQRLDLASDLWTKPANKLSVGQQQRVAVARALMGQPELLIADEPTSAMDADRRKIFLRLLLEECEHYGASLLFVSHDAELAENFSRVVQMSELNMVKGMF